MLGLAGILTLVVETTIHYVW